MKKTKTNKTQVELSVLNIKETLLEPMEASYGQKNTT